MSSLNFYEVAIRRLQQRIQNVAENVASGSVIDFEQYRALCGRIQGLREAEEELKEIYQSMYEVSRYDDA